MLWTFLKVLVSDSDGWPTRFWSGFHDWKWVYLLIVLIRLMIVFRTMQTPFSSLLLFLRNTKHHSTESKHRNPWTFFPFVYVYYTHCIVMESVWLETRIYSSNQNLSEIELLLKPYFMLTIVSKNMMNANSPR